MASRWLGADCVADRREYNASGRGTFGFGVESKDIIMKIKVRLLLLFLFFLLVGFLSGCVLYDPTAFLKGTAPAATAVMVESSADQIVLQWDPPASAVTKYIVSFRIHGESNWVPLPLGEIPASPLPEFPVQYADLGDGDFDFAIVAENAVGEKSNVHISLDPTAQPPSGWFLRWRK
jgi:hypothetical protein